MGGFARNFPGLLQPQHRLGTGVRDHLFQDKCVSVMLMMVVCEMCLCVNSRTTTCTLVDEAI